MGFECSSESETWRKINVSIAEEIQMGKNRCAAIVLAAGQGKRMGTKIQKQYLELNGKPVVYY